MFCFTEYVCRDLSTSIFLFLCWKKLCVWQLLLFPIDRWRSVHPSLKRKSDWMDRVFLCCALWLSLFSELQSVCSRWLVIDRFQSYSLCWKFPPFLQLVNRRLPSPRTSFRLHPCFSMRHSRFQSYFALWMSDSHTAWYLFLFFLSWHTTVLTVKMLEVTLMVTESTCSCPPPLSALCAHAGWRVGVCVQTHTGHPVCGCFASPVLIKVQILVSSFLLTSATNGFYPSLFQVVSKCGDTAKTEIE